MFVKFTKEVVHHLIFVRLVSVYSDQAGSQEFFLSFDLLNFPKNAVLALLRQPCPEGVQPQSGSFCFLIGIQ